MDNLLRGASKEIVRAQRRTLGEELAIELLEEIIADGVRTDVPLPNERQLADRSGVSRLTVREAISILRQKNVVEIRRGLGTYVRPTSDWAPFDPWILGIRVESSGDIADLLEARRLVEVGVAALAARRGSESDIVQIRAALETMETAEDVEAFVLGDVRFHEAIMKAANNNVLAALFSPIAKLLFETRIELSEKPAGRTRALTAHRRILEAIEAGDAQGAEEAMRAHLLELEPRIFRAQRSSRRRTGAKSLQGQLSGG